MLNIGACLILAALAVASPHGMPSSRLPITKRADSSLGFDNSAWDAAAAKAKSFTSQLTVQEKIGIVTGNMSNLQGCTGNIDAIERVNFGGLCMMDGPQAINRADSASVFPDGIAAAATWDVDLIRQRGVALGEEFKGKGAHVLLGPVAAPLGRNPLGGRNWEGFGPDPYLSGLAMRASILGSQSVGVQTSSKHFIGNEQETQRSQSTSADGGIIEAVSANIDDRTLHELYLWPFADAVRAGTTSVMCSYNRVNQEYSCGNKHLLTDILRDEIGFRGYVVSDWLATHGTSEFANSGLDMEMPGGSLTGQPAYFGKALLEAINDGNVSMDRIDDMVTAVMAPYYLLGQDNGQYPTVDPATIYGYVLQEEGWNSPYVPPLFARLGNKEPPAGRNVRGDHATLIREMGAAGSVLLKNEGFILPLSSNTTNVGVFGNDAGSPIDGLTFLDISNPVGFEYGTLDIGGGSGTGRHFSLSTPLAAIQARVASNGGRVQYILSNSVISRNNFRTIYPQPQVCLVFLKTFATEGQDRLSFELDWNSTTVVNNVADFCNNTIVVTHSAGVNTMPWANHPNVKAIIAAHYPGEESGNSLVDLLWGDVNPSGRLPYTIPKSKADYPFAVTNLTGQDVGRYGWQANYTEGQMIDYRHFDLLDIEPLYAFGFGLSYTEFQYLDKAVFTFISSNKSLAAIPDASLGVEPGGNPDLWVPIAQGTVTIKNTGARTGAAVPQLYMSYPPSVPDGTPVRVLRGFKKVLLGPGEEQTVVFPLTRRDVSYWSTDEQTWRIPEGKFIFQVGFSSRDLEEGVSLALL